MIRQPEGFAAPLTTEGPVLRRIGMAITGCAAEAYRAYAVMLPKETLEEIKRVVDLNAPTGEPNTVYGLEIIECSELPGLEPFVVLYR